MECHGISWNHGSILSALLPQGSGEGQAVHQATERVEIRSDVHGGSEALCGDGRPQNVLALGSIRQPWRATATDHQNLEMKKYEKFGDEKSGEVHGETPLEAAHPELLLPCTIS